MVPTIFIPVGYGYGYGYGYGNGNGTISNSLGLIGGKIVWGEG